MSTKKTLRKGSIHNSTAENRRGASPVISTIIISSTLLIILVVASFVSANVLELQIASTEFEQAKTNMLLLDEVVQDIALRRGSGGYVQFNQRSGGIGVAESTERIKIAAVPVNESSQQSIVILRNATATSGGWTTPDGAYIDGGAYASVLSGKPSASQTYSGYGFDIPFTADVTQVRVRVDAWTADTLILRPNAAGTYQAWTTFGSGSYHWDRTSDQDDETGVRSPNGDTTSKETENIEDTSQIGTINSVTAYSRATSEGSGGKEKYKILVRTSADYYSNEITIDTRGLPPQVDSYVMSTNPNGSAWTWTAINAIQVGAIATSVGATEYILCKDFWIEVNYTPPPTQIRLQVSYDGGTSWVPATPLVQDLTSTETTNWFDVTTLTDWSPDKINSNMIQAKVDIYSEGNPISVYLDWMPIEVTYVPLGEILYESSDLLSFVYRGGSHVSGADNTVRGDNSLIVNMTDALSYLRVETGQGIYIKLDYYRVRIVETGTLVVGSTLYNFIEVTFIQLQRGSMGGSGTVNVKIQNTGINPTTQVYDGGTLTIQVQLGLSTTSRTFQSNASKTVVMVTEITVKASTA